MEQDHRAIKRRTRSIVGIQGFSLCSHLVVRHTPCLRRSSEHAQFREGSRSNHVVVEWQVVGSDDAPRRNAPIVIVIDPEAIDRCENGALGEQSRIESRIREIVERRCGHDDPNGHVDVIELFVVRIGEGDLRVDYLPADTPGKSILDVPGHLPAVLLGLTLILPALRVALLVSCPAILLCVT
ncbi:hypothetical protein [Paraburkholderia sp. PGU19]|uniref:hypothetical protein n=1 Tax=Paraburkholderia sp. PGU19 TaxID=2735434 RepID=UPI0015D9F6BC|nr:hypothetical protein [Paraburkholderia sp. PGU19]